MQYVDLMEKNTKQMLQLVNQILDFRKIQNGKMRLHVSLFNLNEMVDSFEKEFRVMAEENEVSFTFQLAGEDIMVWACLLYTSGIKIRSSQSWYIGIPVR